MPIDHDPNFLNLARAVLEGKAPPFQKKDDGKDKDKKDDDIEIDVKTKDGKVTKLHTKDGDGDGVAGDGTKDEKKVSAPKKKDGDDDGKISDGKSDESKDDSKPASKGDGKAPDAKKDDSKGSPVKDDSGDDGAQEKSVVGGGDPDKDSDDADSDDQDDAEDDEKDELGTPDKDDSDKNVTADAVTGKNKSKVNLKPQLNDEDPGEDKTTATESFIERARAHREFLKAVRNVFEDCQKNHPEYLEVVHDGYGTITAKVMFDEGIEEVVIAEISMGEIKAAASKARKKIASDFRDGVHRSVLSSAANMHSQQETSGKIKARRERVYAKIGESLELSEVAYKSHWFKDEDVKTKKIDSPIYAKEKHQVHYKGEHLGHVEAYETSADYKKNSVRMQDTGVRKTRWRYENHDGSIKGHHMKSKKDAVSELIGSHERRAYYKKQNEKNANESLELDEISKELAARYATRAHREGQAHAWFDGAYSNKNDHTEEDKKNHRDARIRSRNRLIGVERALKRITKEEVEVTEQTRDEFHKSLLASWERSGKTNSAIKKHADKVSSMSDAEFVEHKKKLADMSKRAAPSISRMASDLIKKTRKTNESVDLEESNAQRGTNAASSARYHEAKAAHHEELAAYHENEGNHDQAEKHNSAMRAHEEAANHYHRAAHVYGRGQSGYRHVEKGEAAGHDAEAFEREHGLTIKEGLIEATQDEKAADAKRSYEHHDKRANYHDRQLTNSNLDDDQARAHHKAMKAHQRAADAYSRAHQHFSKGYDSQGEEAMEKAERHAGAAEDHEAEHGL